LLADPLLAVLPEGHRLAHRRSIRLRDLARDRWVMGAPGHPCIDATIAAQSTAGFTPDVAHRTNDWNAATALVSGGHGVALIPKLALETAPPGVVVLSIRPSQPARNIYAVARSGSERSPHIAAALAALRKAAEQRQQAASVVR
jgi:DNA-binding transcriptional LysR family regulator